MQELIGMGLGGAGHLGRAACHGFWSESSTVKASVSTLGTERRLQNLSQSLSMLSFWSLTHELGNCQTVDVCMLAQALSM